MNRPEARTGIPVPALIGDALRARDGVRLLYVPTNPELGVVAGGQWELRLNGQQTVSLKGLTHFASRYVAVWLLREAGCLVDCYGKVSFTPASISP